MEWTLQQQGFDLCYDKRLYDRLVARGRRRRCAGTCRPTPATRSGCCASSRTTTSRAPRPRSAPAQARAAAVVIVDAAGRAPLPRRPARGPADAHPGLPRPRARRAAGRRPARVLRAAAARGRRRRPARRRLAAVRLRPAGRTTTPTAGSSRGAGATPARATSSSSTSPTRPAQARVRLPWDDLAGRRWELTDRLDGERFERDGDELGRRRPVRRARRLGVALPRVGRRRLTGRASWSEDADRLRAAPTSSTPPR